MDRLVVFPSGEMCWHVPTAWAGARIERLDLQVLNPAWLPPDLPGNVWGDWCGTGDGKVFGHTSWLPVQLGTSYSDADFGKDSVPEWPTSLLRLLRVSSGQAGIETALDRWINLPLPLKPRAVAETPGLGIYRKTWETRLRPEHVEAIDRLTPSALHPLFDFLLDANAAFLKRDWQRAILYAAIAMDAGAREWCEDQREQAPDDAVLRRLCGHNDEPPVSVILHEISLHCRRRSLKNESPQTFDLADRVYKRRHLLVHRASSELRDGRIAVDRPGAVSAINAAVEVLNWLGFDAHRFAVTAAEHVDVCTGVAIQVS